LSDCLTACGFRIIEAKSADDAVIELDTIGRWIDLAFTDVRLPGSIDGLALAPWIRAYRPQLPVIIAPGAAQMVEGAHQICEGHRFMAMPYKLEAAPEHVRLALKI
jgi:DNA-binding NtrC family response regulator